MANELGYGIKLNTVVTSANAHDDMTKIVKKINPTRWKIFQVLKIEGENDGHVEVSSSYPNQSLIDILDAMSSP